MDQKDRNIELVVLIDVLVLEYTWLNDERLTFVEYQQCVVCMSERKHRKEDQNHCEKGLATQPKHCFSHGSYKPS